MRVIKTGLFKLSNLSGISAFYFFSPLNVWKPSRIKYQLKSPSTKKS
jgi:hypothetical protein